MICKLSLMSRSGFRSMRLPGLGRRCSSGAQRFLLRLAFRAVALGLLAVLMPLSAGADRKADLELCDDFRANQDERIAACTRLIEEETGTAEERASLFNNRADAWFRLGEYEKSLADRSQAIRVDPDGTSGYCGRAGIHERLGNVEQMREDTAACIRLTSKKIAAKPEDIDAYRRRAHAHMVMGDMDAAIDDVSKTIELKPDNGFLWVARGYYRQIAGRHRLAVEDLTKAIDLGVTAFWQRAQSYKALGEYENALSDLDASVKSSPERKMTRYFGAAGRAAIYRNMGELEKALEHANKAVSLVPSQPFGQFVLGDVYHLLGRHQEAIAPLSRALEKESDVHRGWYARGYAYEQAGKTDLAIRDYKKVLSLGDPKPEDRAWDPWEARANAEAVRLARARLKALGHAVPKATESGAGSGSQPTESQ